MLYLRVLERGEEMGTNVTEHAWYALHEPLRAFLRKRVRNEEVVEDLLQASTS